MKYIKTYESVSKDDLQEELYDLITNHRYFYIKKHSIAAYKVRKQLNELIKLGVDINKPYINSPFRDSEELPLWTAIHIHSFYLAELLINAGADVNKNISDKFHHIAPIGHLAAGEDMNILKKVIEAGLDWNIKYYGETFLQWLKIWEKDKIIKEYPEKYKEFLEKEELLKNAEKYNL